MKSVEMKNVFIAVKLNVEIYHSTQGEGAIVGVEGFTPAQLKMFEDLLDKEYYLASK